MTKFSVKHKHISEDNKGNVKFQEYWGMYVIGKKKKKKRDYKSKWWNTCIDFVMIGRSVQLRDVFLKGSLCVLKKESQCFDIIIIEVEFGN